MPDDFGQTLREGSARFSERTTPTPAGLVRARGDRRRRRTVAASVVLAAVVIVGGFAAGYDLGLGQPGHSAPPVAPRPSTSTTGPAPRPSQPSQPARTRSASASASTPGGASAGTPAGASASAPADTSSAPANSEPGYGALAGVWRLANGTDRYLIVYPDGVLGIGQAGNGGLPLCAGQVQPPVSGAYPIAVACSDYGTTGLSLTVADGTLTLHVPASASSPAETIPWVLAPATLVAPSSQNGSVAPAWLVGTWRSTTSSESFTAASTGAVTWTLAGQLAGQTYSGRGTLEAVSGGVFRIATSFGSPPAAGIWQIAHLDDGQLEVIGAYGPLTFSLSTP